MDLSEEIKALSVEIQIWKNLNREAEKARPSKAGSSFQNKMIIQESEYFDYF